MDSERKTILKLTVLNLCDLLNNDQIEELIALGEHLLDAAHNPLRLEEREVSHSL